MNIQQPEQHNDVHFTGQLFARIPHAFLKDVKDPVAVAVYNHLMVYADWNSGLAHPKRETLARSLGYKTTRAVDNAIKHLVEENIGITFLYESTVRRELDAGLLHTVEVEGFSAGQDFNLVYLRDTLHEDLILSVFERHREKLLQGK